MTADYDSIVLLGYSGVGKDTIANKLTKDYPNLVNVKFSALTKDLLAQAWRVPRSWLDGTDKEPKWREQKLIVSGAEVDLTPLDILAALFHGAQVYDKLHDANIKYALDNISESHVPVFTDVRRDKEYRAILKAGFTPFVLHLSCSEIKPGVSDDNIPTLISNYADDFVLASRGSEQLTYNTVVSWLEVQNLISKRKPTLHICIGVEPTGLHHLYPYEPLSKVIDALADSLANLGIPDASVLQRLNQLINSFVSEANLSQVVLESIESDRRLDWQNAYVPLLPRLRQMTNIQLYTPKDSIGATANHFTTKEVSNAIVH